MRLIGCLVYAWLLTVGVAFADETLPVLKVGNEVYTNVTVTSVSATDVYFSFAGGLGNAKLKKLDPELQQHFHYNSAKAGEVEQKQRAANAEYRQQISLLKPATKQLDNAPETATVPSASLDENGDVVVSKLYAKSFRGQRPPQIFVDQWLTPAPDVTGKFVLVDIWATTCEPCRAAIPHLNDLQAKFKDRLVIIGLSDETPEDLCKLTAPRLNYWVGTDPQARSLRAFEVEGIPHAVLIDPKGIVRFEGMPSYLDEAGLARLIGKYGN